MNTFFEKKLEQIVFEQRKIAHTKGLDIFYENAERQVYLSGKKVDILTWEIKEEVIYARIIEFKREKVKEGALFQVLDYYQEFFINIAGAFKGYKIEMVLVGTEISLNVKSAANVTNNLKLYEYDYNFDGIFFKKLDSGPDRLKKFFHKYPADEDYQTFRNKLLTPE